MSSRIKEYYKSEVAPSLVKSRGYSNVMEVPRVKKIVINMGVNAQVDKDELKQLAEDLGQITGQKAVITRAKKSVSNFKLREGMAVGCKVTLRGLRMYDFLERLIHVTLPRIRDFRGISPKGFDGAGNYNLGLQEQTIFPEINPDKVKKTHGMDISIVTSAGSDDEALELLKLLGMPFTA